MVKLPIIIICESGDVHIYDSIDEAARSMESIDVIDGVYTVYDSEGYLLDLHVDERYVPLLPKWLSWLGVPIGLVEIRGRKESQPREQELRGKLVDFLRRLVEDARYGVQLDANWLSTATLAELIAKARHPRT
jgi:hypothetical protein